MQNDVVRHKLRVIGIEAFTVYAMCCYFMDCPDRFSLKRMDELSGMSEDACEEAMKTLVKARLIATRGAGAELRYFVVQYRETEAAKE